MYCREKSGSCSVFNWRSCFHWTASFAVPPYFFQKDFKFEYFFVERRDAICFIPWSKFGRCETLAKLGLRLQDEKKKKKEVDLITSPAESCYSAPKPYLCLKGAMNSKGKQFHVEQTEVKMHREAHRLTRVTFFCFVSFVFFGCRVASTGCLGLKGQ